MNQQPLVSIVLPTYNRACYLSQAITSALNQTYQNIELIVVDDCSTDSTESVIATFDDKRLKYIKLPKNVGRSAARNHALRVILGDFVCFLDSDDYFLPFKIELQLNFFEANQDVQMVYTASGIVRDCNEPIKYFYRAPLSGYLYNEIAFFKPLTITLPTVMLRREVLDKIVGFDEKMDRFEDTDFWRRISKHFKIGAIDQVTCHIRSHAGNHISFFEPHKFELAIDYYLQKIETEDGEIDPLIFQAGSRRLYELYGSALMGVPDAAEHSKKMFAKAQMLFQPLVSIIIPVFNGQNFLAQAIDSALAQTYSNVEVIIVNDGSTDGGATERISLAYGDCVRYYSKANGGCASALNYGVRHALGEYISWLSHDDLITPTKIEKQVAFLVQQGNPRKTIVYGDYSVFCGNHPRYSYVPAIKIPNVKSEKFRYFLTTQNILHGCTLLIPKVAILQHGMFDENLKTVLDFDLWFKLAKTENFVFLPGVVVHARSHPDQDTNRKRDLHMKEANKLLARFAEELSDSEVRAGSGQPGVVGYYMIAETLWRRNFHGAASHVLRLAEKCVTDVMGEGVSSAPRAAEIVESLLLIARNAVMRDVFESIASGEECVDQIQYEGFAFDLMAGFSKGISMQNSTPNFLFAKYFAQLIFVPILQVLNSFSSTKKMVRFLFRRLPISVQGSLSNIWHQYKN